MTMKTERVKEAINEEPFGKTWSVWCHPHTFRELIEDCASLQSKENLTPKELFGRQFTTDRHLPKDEFFSLPDSVSELKTETLRTPPGQFVRELIESQGVRRIDDDMATHVRVDLWYEVTEMEYWFDMDQIKQAEEIKPLRDLINKHIPEDHPPASPEHVDWESTDDRLEVDAGVEKDGDYYWVWKEHHQESYRRVPFTYSIDTLQVVDENEIEYHLSEARKHFVELAIDTIGETQRSTIEGTVRKPDSGIETVEVGEQITELDGLQMTPREAQW